MNLLRSSKFMENKEVQQVVEDLTVRLSGKRLFLEANINLKNLNIGDIDAIVDRLIKINEKNEGIHFITNKEINDIIESIKNEKVPLPIEVSRSAEYKPIAADIEADYSIRDYDVGFADVGINSFIDYFNDRLNRIKEIIRNRQPIAQTPNLRDISRMKDYTDGKEVSIIGIVRNKRVTKNNNLFVEIEDSSGIAKVIFTNRTYDNVNLYEAASSLVYDEVIAVKGKILGELFIAKGFVWPDIPLKSIKYTEDDIAIAFTSDIHIGSKNFMERNFRNMIGWLNGTFDKDKKIAQKIKYMIIGGDIADGIGVYPGQERDLKITDMYVQYRMFAEYIDAIPDYIHVFIIPGNHDATQRAEPQPKFSDELIDIKKDNIHFLNNPSYIKLHNFEILTYHGTSLDSIIGSIPGKSYAKPENAMIELLKRRHLSPIYGGNIIVPSKRDNLVIDTVPDILQMGHIHKNGRSTYHGVDVINSGTWQSLTDFQIRQGHIPTPCKMPVMETKTHRFSTIDFGS